MTYFPTYLLIPDPHKLTKQVSKQSRGCGDGLRVIHESFIQNLTYLLTCRITRRYRNPSHDVVERTFEILQSFPDFVGRVTATSRTLVRLNRVAPEDQGTGIES